MRRKLPYVGQSVKWVINQTVIDGVNQILFGRAEVSSLDQLVADWRSAGGDQMRNEFQQALQSSNISQRWYGAAGSACRSYSAERLHALRPVAPPRPAAHGIDPDTHSGKLVESGTATRRGTTPSPRSQCRFGVRLLSVALTATSRRSNTSSGCTQFEGSAAPLYSGPHC
jgi:hypothetical protein